MSVESASPSTPFLLRVAENLDPRVVLPALLLTGVGLTSLASTRSDLVGTQLSGVVVGIAAATALMLLPYKTVMQLAWPAWIASILLLAMVWAPGIGVSAKGASRWIRLGSVQVQPSEFAKVAQVLMLARYVRFRQDHKTFRGLFTPFALTLVPFLLVVKEPDLGSAMLLVPTLFAILWAAGARTRHLLAVVVMGIASLPVVYEFLHDYQRTRVHTFVNAAAVSVGFDRKPFASPDETPADLQKARDAAHQTRRAELAVAAGGLLGAGWGEGRMNVGNKVPEDWTDFIYVVHAEEWGFAGTVVLVGLYALLFFSLASLAQECRDPAARLMCVGVLASLGFQTCVNLLMTLQLAPVTGVPLPFLSYGRSAMLSAWLLLGLALHAKAREPHVFTRADFD